MYGYQRGGRWRGKLGVWDSQIHSTTCKITPRIYCTADGIIINILKSPIMKKNLKKNRYLCITESLCGMPEITQH